MAINDDSKIGMGQPQQQTAQQPQPGRQQQVPGNSRMSFASTGLFAAPISRGLGSEVMTKLQATLAEIYKDAQPGVEIQIIPIDNINETALAFSLLVICMRYKAQPDRVAYHTLIIEATGDKIQPVFENNGPRQIEITRVTGDAYDHIMTAKVFERVRAAYPNATLIETECCVVPRNFNPDDKVRVHQLALNAGLANGTFLEVTHPEFVDLNLADACTENQLVVNIQFNSSQVEDAAGEPMRSDFLINFSSQRNAVQANKSINSGDRQISLTEVSGFFDVVWAPLATGPAFQPQWNQGVPPPTQKYAARAILTNLASNLSYSPASILMAIATAATLRDDNNWVQAFRPKPIIGNDVDLRDIGALNIEANLLNDPSGYGQPIDTKAESFRLENLGQLVSSLFQPGLIMSMDVPDAGPNSWFLSMFAAAAKGNTSAQSVIFESAQDLTNGEFQKYFTLGDQMFVDVDNRVHLGHWIDRNGVKRDIREIDYLAVANLIGSRDPVRCRAWSDTWTRDDYPLIQRLAERKKMIMALTSESAVITGFANRVTFSAKLMDALTQGCRDAGLVVRINTPLSSADFNTNRGVARFANDALLGASGRSFAQYGTAFNPQFAAGVGNFNRWNT